MIAALSISIVISDESVQPLDVLTELDGEALQNLPLGFAILSPVPRGVYREGQVMLAKTAAPSRSKRAAVVPPRRGRPFSASVAIQ